MEFTQSLKENRDFKRIYSRGKSRADKLFVLYYAKNRIPGKTRLGITVSGKLGGAVARNRIRRRIKEAYRINESKFATGLDIVVVARARALEADFHEICDSILALAEKQGILRESAAPESSAASKPLNRDDKNR